VWALFDWDEQGWASFVADPDVPPILQEATTVHSVLLRAGLPTLA
jgi:hypothetical protein